MIVLRCDRCRAEITRSVGIGIGQPADFDPYPLGLPHSQGIAFAYRGELCEECAAAVRALIAVDEEPAP